MGMDSSVARLRVLQSRCACESRHQLRELPWADQSHAGGFRCEADEHGLVPGVSSASGKFFAPGRPDHQFGLEAGGCESGRIRCQVRTTKRHARGLVEEETADATRDRTDVERTVEHSADRKLPDMSSMKASPNNASVAAVYDRRNGYFLIIVSGHRPPLQRKI